MNPPPPVPKCRKKSPLFVWLVVAVFLGIPALFAVWRLSLSSGIHSRKAALRQAGYPTSLAELQEKYYGSVDPSNNAAEFFNAAFRLLKTNSAIEPGFISDMISKPTNAGAPYSPQEAQKIVTLLAENREALSLLHKVPPGNVCRYPMDFRLGSTIPLPHLTKIKASMQLLSLEALWDQTHGRTPEALADWDAAFCVSESLRDEPIEISQLVRFAGHAMIGATLERVLNNQALDDPALAHLAQQFRAAENPSALEHTIAGELCFAIDNLESRIPLLAAGPRTDNEDEKSLAPTGPPNPQRLAIVKLSGFMDRELNFNLKFTSEYLAAAKLPYPQKLDTFKTIAVGVSNTARARFYIITRLLTEYTAPHFVSKYSADVANLSIFQTVIAIERYRLANQGRLPETLADLAPAFLPAVPMDPFDGQPLRFKKLAPGYEVYSIGINRTDDAGVDHRLNKKSHSDDITFTVRR